MIGLDRVGAVEYEPSTVPPPRHDAEQKWRTVAGFHNDHAGGGGGVADGLFAKGVVVPVLVPAGYRRMHARIVLTRKGV